MQQCKSLKYERSSEPLHISAKQLFLSRELYRSSCIRLKHPAPCASTGCLFQTAHRVDWTPTQSHISPSILVYEGNPRRGRASSQPHRASAPALLNPALRPIPFFRKRGRFLKGAFCRAPYHSHVNSGDGLWEGYHESKRYSRDTYPESYFTKYTSIRRLQVSPL